MLHENGSAVSTNQSVQREDDNLKSSEFAKTEIVWRNVVLFVILHILSLYGLYIANLRTFIYGYIIGISGGIGVTAGAHRLWCHRGYKAKLPLRVLLMILQTIAVQNDLYEWCRDHRMHHKYSETNADPHNSKRGFFFSHIGWLMVKKHPDIKRKGKTLDMSDLLEDPVVMFQKRHYKLLVFLISFLLPSIFPVVWWGEKCWMVVTSVFFSRLVISLHITWLVNSAAHMWGAKDYDKGIEAKENYFVSFIGLGEGFHNYHHVFPWDYATSEFGWKLNFTTLFIDTMAFFGQAYDRRKVPPQMIKERKERTGSCSL